MYLLLQERVNAGLPTAMAATTMIAVGTSHGLVLVFDSAQTLRWCLGETAQDQGSVASLSFNHDCTRLLAGFARGHILMFDIISGKLLRTMSDVHPPGTAVLHVKVSFLIVLSGKISAVIYFFRRINLFSRIHPSSVILLTEHA
jgi:hypothetical protein